MSDKNSPKGNSIIWGPWIPRTRSRQVLMKGQAAVTGAGDSPDLLTLDVYTCKSNPSGDGDAITTIPVRFRAIES